jgi:hypothetical protein
MPTLEDTIEFQASTLNDLLDAEAKSVAVGSDGEGKYRSWAFLATAAAGLLAILLVVALLTDSGGGGGSADASAVGAKAYPGMPRKILNVSSVGSDIALNSSVDIAKGSTPVVSDAKVTKIDKPKGQVGNATIEVALTPEQLLKVNEAFPKRNERANVTTHVPGTETTVTTSAPAATPPPSTADTVPATPPPPG